MTSIWCSKRNHFSLVCQQKIHKQHLRNRHATFTPTEITLKVYELHDDLPSSSEDELWALSFPEQVNTVSDNKNMIYAAMEIGDQTLQMQINTGASCNVLPHRYLPTNMEVTRTKQELVTYAKSK